VRSLYNILDIKLQMYFIVEVDLGLYNTHVHSLGFDTRNPTANPHLMLRHLSFDQNADREIQDPVGTNNEFCVVPRNRRVITEAGLKEIPPEDVLRLRC
jgi:hypothetical protein